METEERIVSDYSVSLFSSAGIGDLGIHYGCELPVDIFCELLPNRANLIQENYPHAFVVRGDIWENVDEIVAKAREKHGKTAPRLLTLSPPCQGMSSNGLGRINNEKKQGKRPEYDPRNRLILPSLDVIEQLLPEFFLIENAPSMMDTEILIGKKPQKIGTILEERLGGRYEIYSFQQNFSHYGVPQSRNRSITIGRYSGDGSHKIQFHAPEWFDLGNKNETVTLRQALSNHTRTSTTDRYHQPLSHNENMMTWISNIPKNSAKSAHFNACVECDYPPPEFGIIECDNPECGAVLPRPQKDGRAIKGFKTSYKRMDGNKPASTVTMNSGSPSSDTQIHYSENRTNTIREVMILTTFLNSVISKPKYSWEGKYSFKGHVSDKELTQGTNIIRDAMGEAIPPLAMQRMVQSVLNWGDLNQE